MKKKSEGIKLKVFMKFINLLWVKTVEMWKEKQPSLRMVLEFKVLMKVCQGEENKVKACSESGGWIKVGEQIAGKEEANWSWVLYWIIAWQN